MQKYENNFEMTEELYLEVIRRMAPFARYIIYAVAVVFLGVGGFVIFIGKNYFQGFVWLAFSVLLFLGGCFGISMQARKIYRASLTSISGKDGVFRKRTLFYDKEFKVIEPTKSASFKYSDISKVTGTRNLYVILLRDKRFTYLKKGCFFDSSDGEFIDFLKSKCNAE
jgi:hypothetical protein